MDEDILITQAEAAQILDRSVSTVSRCLRNGKLHYADEHKRLLLRQGLEDRFRAATRPRIDVPQTKCANPPGSRDHCHLQTHETEPIEDSYWSCLLEKLTFAMAGSPFYWQREPNAHQLMLFCITIDELRQQCEREGLQP